MIGFSITTWFIAVIMIGLGISLLKGNDTFVHGNVFDRTKDKAGYAKQLGKPVLLLASGIAISGVIAVVLPQKYAMSIVIIFLLFVVAVTIGLFYRVDKYFRNSLSE
ncbi:hypothetical protein [Eubacterium ramulus]